MGMSSELETFEKEFIELISEFQSITSSESRLRELVRTESARAEAAEAGKASAERAAADARASAAAATAAATQAAQALASVQDDFVNVKMKLELMEGQHGLLEEKNVELVNRIADLENELQQLRPIQLAHCSLKSQYVELLERINAATEDARSESTRLGNELRRVEKCASAGTELRERARLAAAAHARERRLAAAELQHTSKELHAANVEMARLSSVVSDLQYRLSELTDRKSKGNSGKDVDQESLVTVRAALESERAGTARLERALAAAVADNATLASKLHSMDNDVVEMPTSPLPESNRSTSVCPIDSFLEDC